MQWICSQENNEWQTKDIKVESDELSIDLIQTNKRQTWTGFGGCFNELGWEQLCQLPDDVRLKLMKDLFADSGCGLNYCRLPIGANDYALEWYSCNEIDNDFDQKNFSIDRDKEKLIPYIKEALQIRPDIIFHASPWSPPTWFKFPKAYNYGKMIWKPEYLKSFAIYLLKYVQEYRKAGIEISHVMAQNEMSSNQKFPSCIWTPEEMRDFIRDYMGSVFEEAGEKCEIWLGTLEKKEYDFHTLTAMMDKNCRRYIKGFGYQWEGRQVVQRTSKAWPDYPMICTENQCCQGQNSWVDAEEIFSLVQWFIANNAVGYAYWNMVLQPGGESSWGWKQNSMITVDGSKGEVVYNPEFCLFKHFSHFIRPQSVRRDLEGPWSGNSVCFENVDGTIVYVVHNPLNTVQKVVFDTNNGKMSIAMPAHSFNTVIF